MKTIKFRAWDKADKEMYYNIQNGIKFDDESEYTFSEFINKKEDDCHQWEVMQFSGFFDKQSKEIYEGDIIKEITIYDNTKDTDTAYYNCIIFFGECAFLISYEAGMFGKMLSEVHCKGEQIEVVGNIYEDGHLLDNKIETSEVDKKPTLEWGETCDNLLNWEDAKKWCEEQGEGWRLPTINELIQAYEDKESGFHSLYYWSSTEYGPNNAWDQNFSNGAHYGNNKKNTYSVRAVKTII